MIRFYFDADVDSLEVSSDLTGSCTWIPDGKNKENSLTLTIGWRTEGRGSIDSEIIYETELIQSETTYFKCKIPVAGPISYDGKLLRIIWEIVVSRRKWLGKDTLKTQIVRVIPQQKR
ncbi:hypothetical protein H6G54_02900 [Anabaena cylindrica FACHB-243]|uniref:Arrestin-like N-terminal domain-containing protein n=1 Tax=Anabaena cylindrica (strain ATCC 27899 / PCC 7122) TaxID=272123 RepID=K9ZRW5_ANACC|nr:MULTISPECIES: hypothetical protein [Anabaena]AFZ61257.1 hypothetical protein Anacy_5974 [Anabaena cylindrica PCC 7122]MBD2416672.1 hypothetical protein [Anabaena cylindrica FACHB-243]MBY5284609.1 hypothetical protein [Anabaena sp. CCAP 1446/1C]MBY5308421.1 hypothetical protein [Anabaena sp. CCAP 1446/1C]MCM2408695.1 hypothetical protein [Anabaena sp. CCAP 1446/1C]